MFFDGVCNLCNRSIQYIIRYDKKGHFYFAPLQSDIAEQLLPQDLINKDNPESVIFFEQGKIYDKSTAALRIAKKLDGFPKLLWSLMIVPRPIRDFFYKIIAKNRYKWFGKKNECMVPTPELKKRFLD